MADKEPRKFTGAPAVRASVPLWIGIYGPSFSGKTYSGLLLAEGIRSVCGGEIGVADTEKGRALHYADEFKFRHYAFDPPFGPSDYRDLLEQMHKDGITIAIVDSASHEHEGIGGVLEMHDEECERLMAKTGKDRDRIQMLAWNKPKTEHRKMVQAAQQLGMHIIWNFRAKEKLEVKPGKQPVNKGFMPIGAEDLVYEMTMTALLLPGAYGRPTWQSDEIGERQMIKLPHWAKRMLKDERKPLDRELGARLATWAQGTTPATAPEMELAAMHGEAQPLKEQAKTEAQAASQEERREFLRILGSLSADDRKVLKLDKFDIAKLHTMDRERVLNGMAKMRAHVENKEVQA